MNTFLKAGLIISLALGLGTAADAATVNVTTVVDEADGSCADGDCSLRDAVSSALAGDTVSIPAGTYVLTLGEILIGQDLTLTGAGARSTIIDGNDASRIFLVVVAASQGAIVEISDLTIRNGAAISEDSAGGIANVAILTITRCIVTDNWALVGAGITNLGDLTIRESAVVGNQSESGGGGIFNLGSLTLVNSTVSGNTGPGSEGIGGSGILNFGELVLPTPATFTAINSTIASNVTGPGSGGGIYSVSTQVSLVNTIISGNTGNDCVVSLNVTQTSDHSLDSDGSCGLTGSGDLSGIDPLLGPLADNGGPTDTHAPLAGSPAIDAGSIVGCPPIDQRGVTRPQGAGCDIGAVEASALTPLDQIEALIAQINALVAEGALAANKANPLITKLENVADKLDAEQITAACNQLGAFINQVNAYINSGKLTLAQGQALIDAAEAIQADLCGNSGPAD